MDSVETVRDVARSSRSEASTHPWLPRLLALVSAAYLLAGTTWLFTDTAFPFGPVNDPLGEGQSLLGGARHDAAAPYVMALALLGLVTSGVLLSRVPNRMIQHAATVLAAVQGVLYAVVIPDGRPLIAAAHVPVLLAGKPFGWPPDVTIRSQVPWPVAHQAVLIALGAAWLVAAVLNARCARGACARCGRTDQAPAWTRPAAARRWGRWAVWAAMAAPAAYASSRLAWAMDVPYGVTSEWLREMRADEPTIFVAGAAMALMGLGGATLTCGLVARWGEQWPRWVPVVGGRPVPVQVALVPSLVVAALLVSAGKGWFVSVALGRLPEDLFGPQWATVVFGATLPPWGLALAAAGYAYWLRRRGTCARCGRRD